MTNECEKLGDNLIKNSHVEGGDILMTKDKIKIGNNKNDKEIIEFMQSVFDVPCDTNSTQAIKDLFIALQDCGFSNCCGYVGLKYQKGLKMILKSRKMTEMMCRLVDVDKYNKVDGNIFDNPLIYHDYVIDSVEVRKWYLDNKK